MTAAEPKSLEMLCWLTLLARATVVVVPRLESDDDENSESDDDVSVRETTENWCLNRFGDRSSEKKSESGSWETQRLDDVEKDVPGRGWELYRRSTGAFRACSWRDPALPLPPEKQDAFWFTTFSGSSSGGKERVVDDDKDLPDGGGTVGEVAAAMEPKLSVSRWCSGPWSRVLQFAVAIPPARLLLLKMLLPRCGSSRSVLQCAAVEPSPARLWLLLLMLLFCRSQPP
jgi:hypothetical protein